MCGVRVFVGTSGFMYPWNPDGLEWYVRESGFNALELNMSFYRFPTPSQVRGWAERGRELRWSIKVTRFITHLHRFGARATERWRSFRELFEPMDSLIDFYLFQLPPAMGPAYSGRIGGFAASTGLGRRFALEWRSPEWFSGEWIRWAAGLGITLVSVDAPGLPRTIFRNDGTVYLRMHGRSSWYGHRYSREELLEVARAIARGEPESVYVYFNNDHDMLDNGRELLGILRETARGSAQ